MPLTLTIVTRRGCHLCEEMEATVRRVLGEDHPVELLDLDEAGAGDPALLARWTTLVPVLLVDGEELAHWRVDEATVRSLLR
ncbi:MULTISPECIES: glutaredoxin family protein [unclassified Ornithinimicrobium]|uniref:glutaredoxin family protein n=1 Tax=unclassified Ornithinimicrobium TaxID=2615080 RepID=UPI003854330A